MKTLLQDEARTIQVTAGGTLTAGTGTLIGQLFGVPEHDAVSGEEVTLRVFGVVTLAKTSALQIDVGDAVYWDSGNSVVNKTATAQKEVGIAVSNAVNPSPTVDVFLLPNPRASSAV